MALSIRAYIVPSLPKGFCIDIGSGHDTLRATAECRVSDFPHFDLHGGESGGYYYALSGILARIPDNLLPLVKEVSLFDSFDAQGSRASPGYYVGSAREEAVVERTWDTNSKSWQLEITVRARLLEGAIRFYSLIRAGKLKPDDQWNEDDQTETPDP